MGERGKRIRCPCCGSIWTRETMIPDVWECRNCYAMFPPEAVADT